MPERTVENFGFKGPKPRTSNKKNFITPNSELRTPNLFRNFLEALR